MAIRIRLAILRITIRIIDSFNHKCDNNKFNNNKFINSNIVSIITVRLTISIRRIRITTMIIKLTIR